MANFAPAYYRETNATWLNHLVEEVIDANCRNYGRDWDDDLVDDPDYISDDEKTVTSDGSSTHGRSASRASAGPAEGNRRAPSRMSSLRHSRSRSQSQRGVGSPALSAYQVTRPFRSRMSPSAPATRQNIASCEQMPVSPVSAVVSDAQPSGHGERMLEDGTSTNMISPLSLGDRSPRQFHRRWPSHQSRTVISPETIPESPAPPYEENDKHMPMPLAKSLHRSLSSQGWDPARKGIKTNRSRSQLQRQPSVLSAVSEFSGFAPHPGVRPLEHRKVLGEAAGPTDDEDLTQYPTGLPLTLIIIGICLSTFLISLDRNIITTAIPQITARFHSYEDIGWYGSAYLLTASAFQPLYGRIYMSFETKSSYLNSLAIFAVGSLICGLSPSSVVLIIGRAIQGLGSAGLLTGSFVVATYIVPLQKRPVLFACVGMLYAVGALCGPLLGGAFTDSIGWRWCFWINLPVSGITFASIFFFFKHRQPLNGNTRPPFFQRVLRLDLIGNAILLAAATMLFLALQYSEQRYSWSSARCIGLIVGFGITTIIFIAWNLYRGDAALLPPRILKQRTVAASCGAAFFIYGTTLIHAYYLPIWFQAIKGSSAINSGVNMIPYMVANALFGLIAGIFVSKRGLFAPPAILGCAIGCIGSGLLATLKPSTSTATWVGFEILVSLGIGLAIQQGFSAVQTALPLEDVPIGTAAVVASQSIGGSLFVSVGNTLLQNHLLNQNNANVLPGVNIRAVIEMGATNFRHFVDKEQLPELIQLYNESLQAVFIAAVPLMGLAFLCSLCMEWHSVRRDMPGQGKRKGSTEKV